MKITREALLSYGFNQIMVTNPNNESDPTTLELFQRGNIAVGFNGICWHVYNMEFDIPTISGTITTMEELLDGMRNTGLALNWRS